MPERAWRPSRPATILIGIASIWPIVYMCFFMGFMAYSFSTMEQPGQKTGGFGFPALFKYVFVLHLLTMLLMFVLMAVYIIHAFRTDLISSDKKILWVIILFFGGILACPIYWYLYMWRQRPPVTPAASTVP